MARVTVEDSLRGVDNRFDLVLVASKRARDLVMTGEEPNVPWDHDKPTVVALREIAGGYIGMSYLDKKPEVMNVEIDMDIASNDVGAANTAEEADAALIAALSAMDSVGQQPTENDGQSATIDQQPEGQ